MTLAAILGAAGFVGGSAYSGEHPTAMLGALSVGVLAFAYTFGVFFALAIPLGAGAWIWTWTRRREVMPRLPWWLLTNAAAVGWILVGVAGRLFSGA